MTRKIIETENGPVVVGIGEVATAREWFSASKELLDHIEKSVLEQIGPSVSNGF